MFGAREGASTEAVHGFQTSTAHLLYYGSFGPYAFYLLFVVFCILKRGEWLRGTISVWHLLPLHVLRLVLQYLLVMAFLAAGRGEIAPIYRQGSKQMIANVEQFENYLVESREVKGIESHFHWNDYSMSRLEGTPYEKVTGYPGQTNYLYILAEPHYSYGQRYMSLWVIANSETKRPSKVKFLETDVSKFTEAKARDFLEKLAKNDGKE